MFNNEQQSQYCTPRISFSSDFPNTQPSINKHQSSSTYKESPVSSDFEFSITTNSCMINSADQLFFKGKLLPLKEHCTKMKTTLRDELLVVDDDDEEGLFPRMLKNPAVGRWKEKLGLKRSSQVLSKKADRNYDKALERIDEAKKLVFVPDQEVFANPT